MTSVEQPADVRCAGGNGVGSAQQEADYKLRVRAREKEAQKQITGAVEGLNAKCARQKRHRARRARTAAPRLALWAQSARKGGTVWRPAPAAGCATATACVISARAERNQ